jgi:hypothetical protein
MMLAGVLLTALLSVAQTPDAGLDATVIMSRVAENQRLQRPGGGQGDWRGEALIERNEFQPMLVSAEWASKVPLAVAVLLGTSAEQVGAKISYQRFDKDLWSPVTCGG